MVDDDRTADGVGAPGGVGSTQPKKVFLGLPADYYDLTDEQQDEVCGALSDEFFRQLGLGDDSAEYAAGGSNSDDSLVDRSAEDPDS